MRQCAVVPFNCVHIHTIAIACTCTQKIASIQLVDSLLSLDTSNKSSEMLSVLHGNRISYTFDRNMISCLKSNQNVIVLCKSILNVRQLFILRFETF